MNSPPKRPSHKCGERVVATKGSLCCKSESPEPSDGRGAVEVLFLRTTGQTCRKISHHVGRWRHRWHLVQTSSHARPDRHPLRDFFGFVVIMFPVRRVSNILQRYTVDRVRWASTDGPLSKDKFKILVLGGGASRPTPKTT